MALLGIASKNKKIIKITCCLPSTGIYAHVIAKIMATQHHRRIGHDIKELLKQNIVGSSDVVTGIAIRLRGTTGG
jgi:hypothetical protein